MSYKFLIALIGALCAFAVCTGFQSGLEPRRPDLPIQVKDLVKTSWWNRTWHRHSGFPGFHNRTHPYYPGYHNRTYPYYPGYQNRTYPGYHYGSYPMTLFRNSLLWGHALGATPHNLIIGYVSHGDWLVKTVPVKKSSSLWRKVIETLNVTLPATGQFSAITCVQAMDLATDGQGAYATLMAGGPGYRNVSLGFKSETSEPINFMVYVYAR